MILEKDSTKVQILYIKSKSEAVMASCKYPDLLIGYQCLFCKKFAKFNSVIWKLNNDIDAHTRNIFVVHAQAWTDWSIHLHSKFSNDYYLGHSDNHRNILNRPPPCMPKGGRNRPKCFNIPYFHFHIFNSIPHQIQSWYRKGSEKDVPRHLVHLDSKNNIATQSYASISVEHTTPKNLRKIATCTILL